MKITHQKYAQTTMNVTEKPCYFNDKKRKIDFIFIIDNYIQNDRQKFGMLQEYIKNLHERGLQTEEETGRVIEDFRCIKIHAPVTVLDEYLRGQIIDLSCDNRNFKKDKPFKVFGIKWFQNDLMNINPEDDLYRRAPKTFASEKPTDYTDAERILLVEKMLSEFHFSAKIEDTGYKQLLDKEVIEAAYPLHDSSARWNWDWDKPLTDRQILNRYWARLGCFYKQQPLNLIEKYYGAEVAFYFAWLGFYTYMLVPVAIFGLVCIFLAVIFHYLQKGIVIREVCESDLMLCPVCPVNARCDLEPLKDSCETMKLSYALDNPATVLYSFIMCFWGVTFMVLWRRKQAMLKLRWNLNDINVDNSIRPEFIKSAPVWRISSITGEKEYVIPAWLKVRGYIVTFFIYIGMLLLYILGIMIVMYIRLNVLYQGRKSKNETYKEYLSITEAFISAILTTAVVYILDFMKVSAAKWMTNWQNPRTVVGYQRKYITKIVSLSIADVFAPLVYLAYFKGHFYEHPGDATQWTFFGMIKVDVCPISGCLVNLAVQIFTFMTMKNVLRLSKETFTPALKVMCNKIQNSSEIEESVQQAQWEKDFFLVKPKEGFLFKEYITMILQYSFITFFTVAFPLAPMLALLNNVIELRLDAHKMLINYRRIIPKKVNGIEEWNTVIEILTVLGAISNPLLLAYSSALIPKAIYYFKNNHSLKGYVSSTLSEFNITDAESDQYFTEEVICHYHGKRYPPNHELKYERTKEFWHEVAVRTIFFVVLENVCLLASLLLKYIIPVIPRKVEIKLLDDQRILRESRLQRSKSQESLLRVKNDGTQAGPSGA